MSRSKKRQPWMVTRIKHRGVTVRLGEHAVSGSPLYVFYRLHGQFKQVSLTRACGASHTLRRVDLGSNPAEQEAEARRLGPEVIDTLLDGPQQQPDTTRGVTLGALVQRYEARGLVSVTEHYRRASLAALRRVVKHLGSGKVVADIRASELDAFHHHRTTHGGPVAARQDLVALRACIRWGIRDRLVNRGDDPFGYYRLPPRPAAPKRPWLDRARYQKLRAVAGDVDPALPVLLELAWASGRRVSQLLSLQWEDIDLTRTKSAPDGCVTWDRGLNSNKRHEQTCPLSARSRTALETWRRASGGIAGWVFPGRRDARRPLNYLRAYRWFRQAEERAGLEHQAGGGWHTTRRGWASVRKDLPLKDVAEYGGWRDPGVVLGIYQQVDDATQLRVASHE